MYESQKIDNFFSFIPVTYDSSLGCTAYHSAGRKGFSRKFKDKVERFSRPTKFRSVIMSRSKDPNRHIIMISDMVDR